MDAQQTTTKVVQKIVNKIRKVKFVTAWFIVVISQVGVGSTKKSKAS
jgi:hypothetical protein